MITRFKQNLKYLLGIRNQQLYASMLRYSIKALQHTMKKLHYNYRFRVGTNDLQIEISDQWFVTSSNKFFKTSDGNQARLLPELDNPKVIIDAGAFIGEFSCYLAKKYPEAIVYSIEPSPKNFGYLEKNISINNLKNIKTNNVALSDKIGTASFTDNQSSSKLGEGDNQVNTITLKQFCEDNNIDTIDLFKLDIEGSEPLLAKDIDELLFQDRIKNIHIEMGEVSSTENYSGLEDIFRKHNFEVKKLWKYNYWVTKE